MVAQQEVIKFHILFFNTSQEEDLPQMTYTYLTLRMGKKKPSGILFLSLGRHQEEDMDTLLSMQNLSLSYLAGILVFFALHII
jgi:hypothetical protein